MKTIDEACKQCTETCEKFDQFKEDWLKDKNAILPIDIIVDYFDTLKLHAERAYQYFDLYNKYITRNIFEKLHKENHIPAVKMVLNAIPWPVSEIQRLESRLAEEDRPKLSEMYIEYAESIKSYIIKNNADLVHKDQRGKQKKSKASNHTVHESTIIQAWSDLFSIYMGIAYLVRDDIQSQHYYTYKALKCLEGIDLNRPLFCAYTRDIIGYKCGKPGDTLHEGREGYSVFVRPVLTIDDMRFKAIMRGHAGELKSILSQESRDAFSIDYLIEQLELTKNFFDKYDMNGFPYLHDILKIEHFVNADGNKEYKLDGQDIYKKHRVFSLIKSIFEKDRKMMNDPYQREIIKVSVSLTKEQKVLEQLMVDDLRTELDNKAYKKIHVIMNEPKDALSIAITLPEGLCTEMLPAFPLSLVRNAKSISSNKNAIMATFDFGTKPREIFKWLADIDKFIAKYVPQDVITDSIQALSLIESVQNQQPPSSMPSTPQLELGNTDKENVKQDDSPKTSQDNKKPFAADAANESAPAKVKRKTTAADAAKESAPAKVKKKTTAADAANGTEMPLRQLSESERNSHDLGFSKPGKVYMINYGLNGRSGKYYTTLASLRGLEHKSNQPAVAPLLGRFNDAIRVCRLASKGHNGIRVMDHREVRKNRDSKSHELGFEHEPYFKVAIGRENYRLQLMPIERSGGRILYEPKYIIAHRKKK